VDLRVIVSPIHLRLWRVVDSAHPQLRVVYADREDAIDCARGLASDNPPSLVEVIAHSGDVILRERYELTPDGVLTVDAHSGDAHGAAWEPGVNSQTGTRSAG
jgi:hypothetical protein